MIVIDASVALKWILEKEEYSDKALLIYKDHIEGKETVLVPELLFIEVANTLVTKSQLTIDEVSKGLSFVYKASLNTGGVDEKNILKISRLAKKYSTSVYDMLYAVIAKENKTILVTADEGFIQKTGFKFVKHIKDI
ncbi:hypothetical protein A2865_03905 [Candidatus Woesebacteria bacterium RIFCSPHIGHO2_01_FULL_39_17]|uniref:PIN domain-containing protein n=2 Tax=Candidatus Woeseibacteriota TaxID=1752722 RepID=A0A0G0RKI4_9BACT|nr:MAG: PilT protein domain protein [Microgenomates group bacterium GW2011_GWC1_38_12]KKR14127.1 MAG: hypothetical protein UT40_C0005G0056 [Candidatus Woesebacteria bacterium GW2011_GWA1_39_21b]OGM23572.1 MAG: hypothetical protein A2865_03905 [Candidatus Woesebacteria bacterium RIFCSPHIGHO2_01_FULL_39_17]OGM63017.1 MAG: hypothetical protein A3A52_03435 [Candidatus Woesebacteria bacterium RIFCSPLOWO2_01_FULL_39_14]